MSRGPQELNPNLHFASKVLLSSSSTRIREAYPSIPPDNGAYWRYVQHKPPVWRALTFRRILELILLVRGFGAILGLYPDLT
jgi:hypothetical protein